MELWLCSITRWMGKGPVTFDLSHQIFENKSIDRKVSTELFKAIGDHVVKRERGIWLDSRLCVSPMSLSHLGDEVIRWATDNSALDTVETLFHISSTSEGYAFHGAPEDLLVACLAKKGLKVLKTPSGEFGVKFTSR